jgi:lipopolysaccharide heptosyltransferase I
VRIDLPSPPRRILIVKPSALGDIVHALPVLHLLRQKFPRAHITWLATPAFAPLLDGHPLIDRVMLFERRRRVQTAATHRLSALLAFSRQLNEADFDLVIDLQGLFRSGLFTWLTSAATRIGFDYAREGAPWFYTHRVPTPTRERHAVERYLDVAEALGCGRGPVVFDFGLGKTLDQLLAAVENVGPYCVLLPGTNWATKRWPAEHFAELVGPIENELGLRCVVAGGSDVKQLAQAVPAIDLTGQTDLKQLVRLIRHADLVIANDSGPMHIAAALGRPLVTMFGPTNPIRTGPYARPKTVARLQIICHPCYSRECNHHTCMKELRPSSVLAAAKAELEIAR